MPIETAKNIDAQLTRTRYAEHFVERFLSMPFIPEFVFRSPQTVKTTQKEVVDLLISQGDLNILISQKCQEDPVSRDHSKTVLWATKAAQKAIQQLNGALKVAESKKPVWCVHPRRGRVEFSEGLPRITHVIAIVEVLERVQLPDGTKLPLEVRGVPVTYLSVNDLLNLANELRTVPEIVEYLNARRTLVPIDQRVVGDEKALFSLYLLNSGSFEGCQRREEATAIVAERNRQLTEFRAAKAESDRHSNLLEQVAHELATRHPNYAEDIPSELLAAFDDPSNRTNYMLMQAVLANLRLRERAELGRAFHDTIQSMQALEEGFTYRAAYLDTMPDWVFVFASSKKVQRGEVLRRGAMLMDGAMAHYKRRRCLLIVDRDHQSYEVALRDSDSGSPDINRAVGEQLFARLKVTDTSCAGLVP
jgi:hypothetical protein